MENQRDRYVVTGMFSDKESAEQAYHAIKTRGYNDNDVHVIMSDDTRDRYYKTTTLKTELGNKALEGTGTGAAIGTTLGAVAGAVAAIGTNLVLPGLGLVVAGPLAAALAGGGAGAAAGSLIGAMVGAGIPEKRAKVYEDGVKKGHIILGVHPKNDEDAEYLESEWKKNNVIELHR